MAKAKSLNKTPGRGLQKQTDTQSVKVQVTAEAKAQYDSLMSALSKAKRSEASGFDAYWEAVGTVIDKELYVAGGYATAELWATAVVKEPIRTVRRMVRVAQYASPADEATYGVSVLDAAITYVEAKGNGRKGTSKKIDFATLRIPVVVDGTTKTVGLAAATVAQLASATRALQRGKGKAPQKTATEWTELEAAFGKALRAEKLLAGLSVKVSDGAVTFGPVPLRAIERFAAIIRAVPWRASELGGGSKAKPAPKAGAKATKRAK